MSEATLPTTIGDYRVLGLLGEGGSGRVYRAQEASTDREVALKVLRAGAAAAPFQARFRREIVLLGGLEHPGIARLYAAGEAATDSGPLLYFALEYVRGQDLLGYATQHRLDVPARLRLLIAVAEAVHYAHTRGVVHRDLKPGNILVDDSGQPKVLDFGIAQMMSEHDHTQITRLGEVLGTLPYMSWEQLSGDSAAADPRSDVFALGVMAYLLLTGALPFPGGTGTSLMQALKDRQEKSALPLSRHRAGLAGDLETIVMKAIAHERQARYGSAAELAQDLVRYLDHRPIEARRPTASYVVGLFIRRHRALAAGMGLALAALMLGALISLRFGLAEASARREAELRLQEREAINQFLERMLTAADPEQARGRNITVREAVDGALRELAVSRLPPSVELSLRQTLAGVLGGLGDPQAASALIKEALQRVPDDDPQTRAALHLAQAQLWIELSHLAPVPGALDAAATALAALPANANSQRLQVTLDRMRARWMVDSGQPAEAEALLRATQMRAEARFGPRDAATLLVLYDLSNTLMQRGEYPAALVVGEQLVARRVERDGADHPDTLAARSNLAVVLFQLGRYPESRKVNEALLIDQQRVLGREHAATLTTHLQLGNDLAAIPQPAEALGHFQTAAAGFARVLSPQHPRTLAALNGEAYALEDLGRLSEAEAVYRRLVSLWTHPDNRQHSEAFTSRSNLAMLLLRQGRQAEAARLYEALLPEVQAQLGDSHTYLAIYRANAAEVHEAAQQPAAARALLALSLPVLRSQLGAAHPKTRSAEARWLRVGGR